MQLWFHEEDNGLKFSYKIKDVLYRERSAYQSIDVIDTEAVGKMLLIDGLVMITESDEFVYHECIAHIPALAHSNPRKVVVIGGGDGGTVRELLKHPSIEEITLCEIDDKVIEASRRFFPEVSAGLDNPKVNTYIGDGVNYMKNHEPSTLDLVIIDSTDPIGPGEGLFTKDFYSSVAQSLKSNGLMACQSESPWYGSESLQRIFDNVAGGFGHYRPYVAPVSTYPRGYWSWTLASKEAWSVGDFDFDRLELFADSLSYLNKDLLPSVFSLPQFYKKKLGLL